jgi:hypothetical protein
MSPPSNKLTLTMPPGPPSPPQELEFVKTFFVGNGQTTAIDLTQGMAIYFTRPACANDAGGITQYVAKYRVYGQGEQDREVAFTPKLVEGETDKMYVINK